VLSKEQIIAAIVVCQENVSVKVFTHLPDEDELVIILSLVLIFLNLEEIIHRFKAKKNAK
jgi:hypothetical protein